MKSPTACLAAAVAAAFVGSLSSQSSEAAECLPGCVKSREYSPYVGAKQNGVDVIIIHVDQDAIDNPYFKKERLQSAIDRWSAECAQATGDVIPELRLNWSTPWNDQEAPPISESGWPTGIYIDFMKGMDAQEDSNGMVHPALIDPPGRPNVIEVYERCPQGTSHGLECFGERYIRWDYVWGEQAMAHELGHAVGIDHDGSDCSASVMSAIASWGLGNVTFNAEHCKLAARLNDKDKTCNGLEVGACEGCLYSIGGKISGLPQDCQLAVEAIFSSGGHSVTERAPVVGGAFAFKSVHAPGVSYEIKLPPDPSLECETATMTGTFGQVDVAVEFKCSWTDSTGGGSASPGGLRRITASAIRCEDSDEDLRDILGEDLPETTLCDTFPDLCLDRSFWWRRTPGPPSGPPDDRQCNGQTTCEYTNPCADPTKVPDEEGGCLFCYDTCNVVGSVVLVGPDMTVDSIPDVIGGTYELSGWAGARRRFQGLVAFLDRQLYPLDEWQHGLFRPEACTGVFGDCDSFSGFRASIDTRFLTEGPHELVLFAAGGDYERAVPALHVFNFQVENDCLSTSPPSVELGGVVAGETLYGSVTLTATATGAEAIERVEFFVDGARAFTDWTAPYSGSWNTTTVPDGGHQIHAVAVDTCGLSAASSAVDVTVLNANDPPQLALETPTPLLQLSGVATVSGWAVDADSIESVSLRLGTQVLPLASPVEWVDRSDVCSGSGVADPRCPLVGWRTSFDTTLWPDGAHSFQVVAVDGRGASSSRSITVSIRNTPVAPPTVSTPASATVVEGDDVKFTVSASGEGPLTYRWQYRSGTSWVSLFDGNRGGRVSGAGTYRLTLADVVTADQTSYRCLVANEGGTTASSSASLTVEEVVAPPNVTAGLDQRVTEGNDAHLWVNAQGVGPLAYQWQKWGGSWVDVTDGGLISGTTTNMLTIASARSSDDAPYRCRVSNEGGTTYSDSIQLAVDPLPVGTCQENATTLCFQADRFAVTATVNGGSAGAMPFSQEGGFFWMFEPQTVEVAIKILDGTSANGYFWVFHGSLTDLAYTVTVTDTITGASKTYLKDAGHFCGDADTAAFPDSNTAAATAGLLVPLAPASAIGRATTGCASSSTLACLLGGKFGVEVLRSGSPQPGVAVTDLSASFGFVTATAPEVVVKVIDGTSVNGWYWLFFGSLTHQDFTVKVTDGATGEFRTYVSPGELCGGADTAAF